MYARCADFLAFW